MIRIFIGTLICISLLGCRQREGQECDPEAGNQCALGLYCKAETKVCTDRGELLKKKAAETYVYPIPAGKKTKSLQGQPVPTPIPAGR